MVKMNWGFFCVVAFVVASVAGIESTEFSIKPNGKVSHKRANIVRRIT